MTAVKTRLHTARTRLRETLLPAYEELVCPDAQQREERIMVKVEIVDVVTREQRNEETNESLTMHIAVLLDEAGRRVLPN